MKSVRGAGGRRRRRDHVQPNLLDMTPLRTVEWDEGSEGHVTLIRSRPSVRGPRSTLRWIAFLLAPTRVRLDDVGSYAWLHMDGATDVRTVAERVRGEFGDRVEPVHERLGQLVRTLRSERLIRYREEETATRHRSAFSGASRSPRNSS